LGEGGTKNAIRILDFECGGGGEAVWYEGKITRKKSERKIISGNGRPHVGNSVAPTKKKEGWPKKERSGSQKEGPPENRKIMEGRPKRERWG